MKLLKIIVAIFAVYFIKRFIQLYQTMKKIQAEQEAKNQQPQTTAKNQADIIEADFKVIK